MSPTVTVVIPVYNAASFIEPTLQSVLAQTYRDFEVIVVDDGSTDTTREVLENYIDSVRYIYKQNGGQSSSRNVGIKAAKGEFVAFLDHDDIWLENKLELQVREIERSSAVGLVTCGVCYFCEKGDINSRTPRLNALGKDAVLEKLLFSNIIGSCSSALIRATCFTDVGLFDESLHMAEDWDMWFRIAQKYEIRSVEQLLLRYRWHERNFSSASGEVNLRNELVYLGRAFSEERFRHKHWLKRHSVSSRYVAAAWQFRESGDRGRARQCLLKAASSFPPALLKRGFIGLFCSLFLSKRRKTKRLDKPEAQHKLPSMSVPHILFHGEDYHPLVSVIIPAYNAASYLRETLDSVFAQTYRQYEIIVVDDGSTDNTNDVLASYADRIKIIHQKHSGTVASPRNTGVRAANGDLLAFLDADDLWAPNKLEVQVRVLNGQYALVGAREQDSEDPSEETLSISYHDLVLRNRLPASSVVVHRKCIETVGLFDESLAMRGVEDWEMWLRVALRFPVYLIPEPLAIIRDTPGSISAVENTSKILEGEKRVLLRQRRLDRPHRPSWALYVRARSRCHLRAAWGERMNGRRMHAMAHVWLALCFYPLCAFKKDTLATIVKLLFLCG